MAAVMSKEEELIRNLGQQECHVVWDALHTFHHDQLSKGILLRSEDDIIKRLVPLFKAIAFPDKPGSNRKSAKQPGT